MIPHTHTVTALLALLVSSVLSSPAPAPAPSNPLGALFKDAPLLGPLAGLAGGSLVTTGLGFAGKNSILNTINTISNVASAKIGLINLGANLVGAGLQAAEQLQQSPPAPGPAQFYGGYRRPSYRPGYSSYG